MLQIFILQLCKASSTTPKNFGLSNKTEQCFYKIIVFSLPIIRAAEGSFWMIGKELAKTAVYSGVSS